MSKDKDQPDIKEFQEKANPQAVGGAPPVNFSAAKLPSVDNIKTLSAKRKSRFIPGQGHLILFDVSITRMDGKVENVEMVEGDLLKFKKLTGIEMGT
jgi:hypothetical protein